MVAGCVQVSQESRPRRLWSSARAQHLREWIACERREGCAGACSVVPALTVLCQAGGETASRGDTLQNVPNHKFACMQLRELRSAHSCQILKFSQGGEHLRYMYLHITPLRTSHDHRHKITMSVGHTAQTRDHLLEVLLALSKVL